MLVKAVTSMVDDVFDEYEEDDFRTGVDVVGYCDDGVGIKDIAEGYG